MNQRCTEPYCTRPAVISYKNDYQPRRWLCVHCLVDRVNALPGQPLPRLRIEVVEQRQTH